MINSTVFQNLYTRCFKNSFYFKIKSSKNSKHYLLTRLSRAVQKNKISLITKKQKNQYRATSSLYAWIHSWSNLNGDRCCLAKSGVRFLLFLQSSNRLRVLASFCRCRQSEGGCEIDLVVGEPAGSWGRIVFVFALLIFCNCGILLIDCRSNKCGDTITRLNSLLSLIFRVGLKKF